MADSHLEVVVLGEHESRKVVALLVAGEEVRVAALSSADRAVLSESRRHLRQFSPNKDPRIQPTTLYKIINRLGNTLSKGVFLFKERMSATEYSGQKVLEDITHSKSSPCGALTSGRASSCTFASVVSI